MNGVHDMGGMMAFGPVEPEADEPTFRADWERRVFGINIATSATGAWNLDMGRSVRESLPPAEYLGSTYYEIWLSGLEKLVVKYGLVTEAELAAGSPSRRQIRGTGHSARNGAEDLAGRRRGDLPPDRHARTLQRWR